MVLLKWWWCYFIVVVQILNIMFMGCLFCKLLAYMPYYVYCIESTVKSFEDLGDLWLSRADGGIVLHGHCLQVQFVCTWLSNNVQGIRLFSIHLFFTSIPPVWECRLQKKIVNFTLLFSYGYVKLKLNLHYSIIGYSHVEPGGYRGNVSCKNLWAPQSNLVVLHFRYWVGALSHWNYWILLGSMWWWCHCKVLDRLLVIE